MQYSELAEVYDSLIYDMPYEKWADFIEKNSSGDVLELACGTGNLTKLLAKRRSVTALDISPEMLRIADGKLRTLGRRVRFVQGDMRTFALNKPVNTVVCACDGINYLTDADSVKRTFINVHKSLNSGGTFIFDISSYYKLSKMNNELYSEDTDDVTYIWRNSFENDILNMDIAFFVTDDGENYTRFDETHVQRAHRTDELARLLRECGFEEIKITDDYSETEVKNDSLRITFCAKAR